MINNCPSWSLPEHKLLMELFGKGKALGVLTLHNNEKVSPEEAIHELYPGKVTILLHLSAWDLGSFAGKDKNEFKPQIHDTIKENPDTPIGEGESFNQIKERSVNVAKEILSTAPDKSVVVTSSSVLKFIMEWNKLGRPDDLSKITPKNYLDLHTEHGQTISLKGTNGDVQFIRHGKTEDSEDGKLRSIDTQLTDTGKQEADRVGNTLSSQEIPMVYSGDIHRQLQTVDRILSKQSSEEIPSNSINNINDLKHELQSAISKGISGSEKESTINTAFDLFKSSRKTNTGNAERGQPVENIWKKIQEVKLDYKKELPEKDLKFTGGEQKVYIPDNSKVVTKVNFNTDLDQLEKYLEKLKIYNYLFPDTAYKLLGFKKEGSQIQPVLEQPYIEKGGEYDETAVVKMMSAYGFTEEGRDGEGIRFINKDLGIVIDDIAARNVVMKNGDPYIIDYLMEIKANFYNSSKPDLSTIPNKVLAPNGNESKLFNDILSLPEVNNNKEKAYKLYQQTHSKNFKKWFGNSKVVDENGEPLIVYHGTDSKERFSKFNKSETGIFFTDNKEYAKNVTKEKVKKDTPIRIGSFFINMQNPDIIPEYAREEISLHSNDIISHKSGQRYKSGNFDGIIGTDFMQSDGETFVLFEPNQIKSVFNNGEFSTESPVIYTSQSNTPSTITQNSFVTPTSNFLNNSKDSIISYNEENQEKVRASLKSVEVAQTPKALQEWNKLSKGNINFDQFLQNSQFPKEQKDLLKDIYQSENPNSLNDLITSLIAKYSYTVEINTAKTTSSVSKETRLPSGNYEHESFSFNGIVYSTEQDWDSEFQEPFTKYFADGRKITSKEFFDVLESAENIVQEKSIPTQHYSYLTVPGGTNYTENEISTPDITPSIKGHAQFATDNGIGWFRSDDREHNFNEWFNQNKDNYKYFNKNVNDIKIEYNQLNPKTRRILEVQSDLFQKGRDRKSLIPQGVEEDEKGLWNDIDKESNDPKNQFLQLLNKDGNWIPFFIKSIVQDSAKKGYEKVLFPTGDTASKIEIDETLEQFKKQKEDRIKELNTGLEKEGITNIPFSKVTKFTKGSREYIKHNGKWKLLIDGKELPLYDKEEGYTYYPEADYNSRSPILMEKKQLQKELKDIEENGLAILKPIYDFYENRVKNTLNKIYGKDNIERIKDEHGNEWFQVAISQKRDVLTFFTSQSNTPSTITQNSFVTPASSPNLGLSYSTLHLTAAEQKAAKEANARGEIYHKLSPEEQGYIDGLIKDKETTKEQRAVINSLYLHASDLESSQQKTIEELGLHPSETILFEDSGHKYMNLQGEIYPSVTEGIKGVYNEEDQKKYEVSRDIGNDFDLILQGIVLGKADKVTGKPRPLNVDEIETKLLSPDTKLDFYSEARSLVKSYTDKGYLALTQVRLGAKGNTPEQNRAGSPDLLLIASDGVNNIIIDLKTSKHPAKQGDRNSVSYDKGWKPKEGSVFLNTVIDKSGELVERSIENGKLKTEPGDKVVDLSSNLQHTIQIGCYGKMCELQGLPIGEYKTWHQHIHYNKDGKPTGGYTNEGFVDHPVENNKPYIDRIVQGELNQDQWSELQKKFYESQEEDINEETEEEDVPLTEEQIKANKVTLSNVLEKLHDSFSRRKASSRQEVRETSINEIKHVMNQIVNLQVSGELQKAMGVALNYINDFTKDCMKFINKGNMSNPEYYQFLTESLAISNANNQLLPDSIRDSLTSVQDKLFLNVKKSLSNLSVLATQRGIDFIKFKGGQGNVDVKALESWINNTGVKDVDKFGSMVIGPDQLQNPILQQTSYIIQKADLQGSVKAVEDRGDWAKLGNELHSLAGDKIKEPKFWNDLYKVDKNGKVTGYPLEQIGDKFYDVKNELDNQLRDKFGKHIAPIKIYDVTTADQKDLDYNIHLANVREKLREFNTAETLDDKGKIVSGEYHHLSDEYIAERSKYFRPEITSYANGGNKLEYVLKAEYNENSPEVIKFRNRYMTWNAYTSFVKEKGEYTGATQEKEDWFPNKKYVEKNTYKNNKLSGENLQDARWVKLHTPTNDIDRLKMQVYDLKQTQLKAIGSTIQEVKSFVDNNGPLAIQNSVMKSCTETGLLNTIKYYAIDYFTAVHSLPTGESDPEGVERMSLSIPYMGNLRSQEKMDNIKKKIEDLISRKSELGNNIFDEKLKEFNQQLKHEAHKISADDIELDPIKQMMMFMPAVRMYEARKNIEGEVLAYRNLLYSQKFIKTKNGKVVKDSEGNQLFKTPEEVNLFKAIDQLVKLFYGVSADKTNLQVITKKVLGVTYGSAMIFNVWNQFKNNLLYSLNNWVAFMAGRYGMTAEAAWKAKKEINREYLPGVAKRIQDKTLKYKVQKSYSWAEAFMHKFNLHTENIETESGGSISKITKLGTTFERIAIENSWLHIVLTSCHAMNILNHDTNELTPIRGAFTFNPNNGEFTLNKGFKIDDVIEAIVKMQDIQTITQGNYQAIKQPSATHTPIGQAAFQFHRFFVTSRLAMFGKRGLSKSFGENEGTWRSVLTIGKLMKDYDGSWREWFDPKSKAWKENTPEFVKANLKSDALQVVSVLLAAAIGMVIKNIANNISDEDTSQKRWLNFIAYTMSKLRFEEQMFSPLGVQQMAEFAENPIAMTNTLKTFSQAMMLSIEFPFQSEDARYYQRGVWKGDSKAAHQWERLTPVYKEVNVWINFIEDQNFEGSILGSQKN